MPYNSIKKHCKNNCGRMPVLGLEGYCWTCCPEEIKIKVGNRRKLAIKKKNARVSAISKIRSQERAENKENELELWFLLRMNTCEPICQNCGAVGYYLKEDKYKKLWKSCQAHLLPKRHFKSIQSHPLNGAVLGTGFSRLCHCHDKYDHDWEQASQMDIWATVVERFKILYPLTYESEHQFIPQILLDTL